MKKYTIHDFLLSCCIFFSMFIPYIMIYKTHPHNLEQLLLSTVGGFFITFSYLLGIIALFVVSIHFSLKRLLEARRK